MKDLPGEHVTMRDTTQPTQRAARRMALGALVLAMAACGDKDVIAEVGDTRLRRADLQGFQGGRGRPADPGQALDALVARALLAEAGRRAGLADDPAVRARLASSEREILAQAWLDRAAAPASGREDALRKRFEEQKARYERRRIHVAHIAVGAPKGDARARAEAESKASRAGARLTAGEPFEKVAREMSEDPVTAPRGGDLGPLLEGEVDPAFFEAAAALEKGKVSKPVESAFGLHIVKALEDPGKVTPRFEEVKGLVAAEARREAEQRALTDARRDIPVMVHRDRLPAEKRPPVAKTGEAR